MALRSEWLSRIAMKVLILCTGNSCRSQMAEGFVRHFLKGAGDVFSAGLDPKGVHPISVRVMGEIGIDLSGHTSKHLSEYSSMQFDYVITVCDSAAERCPVYPGNTIRLHWPFDDPAAAKGTEWEVLEEFRRIRNQISDKAKTWVAEITAK